MRRFTSTIRRNHRSSLQVVNDSDDIDDRIVYTYPSNVALPPLPPLPPPPPPPLLPPKPNLTGRGSVRGSVRNSVKLPEYSVTDPLDISEASQVTSNYSKRPSGEFKFSSLLICVIFFSLLPYIC